MIAPPPGFELENSTGPAGVAPPPGFEMVPPPAGFEIISEGIVDLPQVNALPPDFSGVTSSVDSAAPIVGRDVMADGWRPGIVRDIALGGRSALRGIGGIVGAIGGDAFNNYIANPIERAVGLPQSGSFRDSADQLANTIGLPSPQNSGERVLGDVGEALSGTAVTMGAGGLLNALANTGRIAQSAPAAQSRLATMLAERPVVHSTGRAAQSAPVSQSRLAEMLTERPVMQSIAAAGGAGASGSVRESGGGTGQQLLAGLAGGLAPSALPAAGMATARGAVRGSSGEQMQRNIDDFAALGAQPSVGQASGNSWVQGAESLLAGGPTSSGVMGRFANSQASEIGAGLRRSADNLSPSASAEDAGDAIRRGVDTFKGNTSAQRMAAYWQADRLIPSNTPTSMQNTMQKLADLTTPNQSASATTGRMVNPRLRQMMEDLNSDLQSGGGSISYEALRRIRTSVGEMMDDFSLVKDTPAKQLDALYGALSRDMEAAARNIGPDAVRAAKIANNYTRMSSARLKQLQRVVDKEGGGEAIYNAAITGSRDGGTRLRRVMSSIPKSSQEALTAATVKRMGMPNPGQAGADASEQFSGRTFLTNWNRFSPEARKELFGRHGKGFSENMDRIARVADNIDQGAGLYRNPSGTANRAAAMTYGASLVGGLFTGTLALPVAAGVAANILARAAVNPKVVASLARATELPVSGIPSTVRELHKIADEDGDDSAAELAEILQSQLPQ